MRPRHPHRAACVLGLGWLTLAGCTARTDVGATGAAPADVSHLWVTVEEVWFAQSADTAGDSTGGWKREKLSSPVVLDLANADSGTLVPLVTGLSLPAGRYRQLHLVMADSDESLVDEARAAGLEYNAQVDIVDSAGTTTRAPLELPVPRAGLTVPIDVTFKDAGRTDANGAEAQNFAVTLDAARDVLSYDYGGVKGYILSPTVSVQDAAESGGIRVSVDASALASGHPQVVVSAQVLDDSGSHRVVVQRRDSADGGTFSLYPLPAGDGATSYDVVIACAGAKTVVIRDVPVTAGSGQTTLQPEPIALVAADTTYADADGASAGLPAGTRVEFYQTLPGGGERPFLVDGTALDPLSRRLPGEAFALGGGTLMVGNYADGAAIDFSEVTPVQRAGGYVAGSSGPYRTDTLADEAVVVTGGSDRPTVVTVPYPEIAASGRSGRLAINVQAPVGRYDRGFITVMTAGRLVDVLSIDELVDRGGGVVFVDGLPSGAALAPDAGVSYRAALRAWNSRNAAGTIQRVAATASASLGDLGAGTLLIEVR